MIQRSFRTTLLRGCLGAALMSGAAIPARADKLSGDLSMLSALPVVVSVTAPVLLIAVGSRLVVDSVELSADGLVWVVHRAADGVKGSVRLTRKAVGASLVGVGAALEVTAVATGWLLSTAGQVVAFVPNEVGRSLLYNEKVSL